jgi:hypothetical protein
MNNKELGRERSCLEPVENTVVTLSIPNIFAKGSI